MSKKISPIEDNMATITLTFLEDDDTHLQPELSYLDFYFVSLSRTQPSDEYQMRYDLKRFLA